MSTPCPICRKPSDSETGPPTSGKSPYPFCSERCKLIDLGRWLDGKYEIPVVEDDLDEASDIAGRPPGRGDDFRGS